MAYAIGAVVLVVVFLCLFDPLLAIAAGAGIVLGLGGTALWTHRSQLIHAVQRLPQALREPRRVQRRLPMVFVGAPIVLAGATCVGMLYASSAWGAVTAVLTGVILGGLTWLLRVRRRQAIHESVSRRVWRVVRLVLLLLLIGIDGLFLVAIVFAVAETSLPLAVAAIVLAAIGVAGALVSRRVSRAGTSPTGGTSDVASPAPEGTQWRRPVVWVFLLGLGVVGLSLSLGVRSITVITKSGSVPTTRPRLPLVLTPRYEGTAVYRDGVWDVTDLITFDKAKLSTLQHWLSPQPAPGRQTPPAPQAGRLRGGAKRQDQRDGTALLEHELQAQGWLAQQRGAELAFMHKRHESAVVRLFPATTIRRLPIFMPATIILSDNSKVLFAPGAQSRLTLKTTPHVVAVSVPTARREASSDQDVLHIDLELLSDEQPNVETQLLSPLFRNELGVTLAGLTVGKAVKWMVLLGAAIGAEQAKETLLSSLRRLLRRLHIPGAKPPPTSRPRRHRPRRQPQHPLHHAKQGISKRK
jgi:hypothetical protein